MPKPQNPFNLTLQPAFILTLYDRQHSPAGIFLAGTRAQPQLGLIRSTIKHSVGPPLFAEQRVDS
jgi:hypothetical protein